MNVNPVFSHFPLCTCTDSYFCQKVTQPSIEDNSESLQARMKDAFAEAESFVQSMSERVAAGEAVDPRDSAAYSMAKNILDFANDPQFDENVLDGRESWMINLAKQLGEQKHLDTQVPKRTPATLAEESAENSWRATDWSVAGAGTHPTERLSKCDRLHNGGPVLAMSVLHTGEDLTGGKLVTNNTYFSECTQLLWGQVNLSGPKVRYFLGMSTWVEGQLQDELERGYWIKCRANPHLLDLFDRDYWTKKPGSKSISSLWHQLLTKMGGEYAVLAQIPDLLHYGTPDDGDDEDEDEDISL